MKRAIIAAALAGFAPSAGARAGGQPGDMDKRPGKTEAERARNLATTRARPGEGAWNLGRPRARECVPGVTRERSARIQANY